MPVMVFSRTDGLKTQGCATLTGGRYKHANGTAALGVRSTIIECPEIGRLASRRLHIRRTANLGISYRLHTSRRTPHIGRQLPPT